MSCYPVAVIGSGPAGMYAAAHLVALEEKNIQVDLIDRLPTPFGLVRNGVAPDHFNKKAIADRLFAHTLAHPRVSFFGNVHVGRDVEVSELTSSYSAVIVAVGASADSGLGIPGESLRGVTSAREFVAWYNGHPDYTGMTFSFGHPRAVIIGNGNVALDVARILTASSSELAKTDIAPNALDQLAASSIEEVVVVARRGYTHAAFNNPEIEEFLELRDLAVSVEGDSFSEVDEYPWETRRKLRTLERLSTLESRAGCKRVTFKFNASPVSFAGEESVERVVFQSRNQSDLYNKCPPNDSVVTTQEMAAGMVVKSVGYRVTALPGLPFDSEKHVIPSVNGRVFSEEGFVPGYT